jgi:hypothetical protein
MIPDLPRTIDDLPLALVLITGHEHVITRLNRRALGAVAGLAIGRPIHQALPCAGAARVDRPRRGLRASPPSQRPPSASTPCMAGPAERLRRSGSSVEFESARECGVEQHAGHDQAGNEAADLRGKVPA